MMGGNDALSRRIERRVENGGTQSKTRFIHDGVRVAEEWDIPATGNPTLEASYVYGNYVDEVLTMRRGDVDYYHHGDDMHNIVKLTDGDGLVVEGYDYGDYGTPEFYDENGARTSATASEFGNPYLFSGREWEEELGLYHFRNRYMDPALGRFTSRDPIGIWGDAANLGNGYTYCASNPWSLVDPFGLSPDKPGGNAMAQYRQQQAETEASRRSETIWAGIAGMFDFGKEDALLATEGISYIPIVGWGADAVLLSEAIARGDTFDTIMAGIGFIPVLGDGAKAIVDTGGRAIRGIKGLRRGAKILDVPGGGIPELKRVIADTDVLVAALDSPSTKKGAAALEAIRGADEVFITPNQLNEFARFRGVSRSQRQARQAFLATEGIKTIDGRQVSQLQGFQDIFGTVAGQHGRGDAALLGAARATGIQAITMEKRLSNYVTHTLQDPSIPIRRIGQ